MRERKAFDFENLGSNLAFWAFEFSHHLNYRFEVFEYKTARRLEKKG